MDGDLSAGELIIETLNNWFLIHNHPFTTLTCYFKEKRRHQSLSPLPKASQTVFGSNDRWTGARPQRSIQVIFIDRPCCPSKTARSETTIQKKIIITDWIEPQILKATVLVGPIPRHSSWASNEHTKWMTKDERIVVPLGVSNERTREQEVTVKAAMMRNPYT